MAALSPETVAARIREAGWEVEIVDLPVAFGAGIRATRPGEKLTVTFDPKFSYGRHWIGETEQDRLATVAAVLAVARAVMRGDGVAGLADADVLAAVAGKTVRWRNSITGKLEHGDVPRGGMHLRLFPAARPPDRILQFTDADGHGFRNVRLAAIEEVK